MKPESQRPHANMPKSWVIFATMLLVAACGDARSDALAGLAGTLEADGSSTVFPVTEAMAEEFGLVTNGRVRVNVGQSGTGGGFKRFCAGETELSNASRQIQPAEQALCEANGVAYTELRVAIDGIAITVNSANEYVDCLTVEELKRIWEPGSDVRTWSDVRPGWPVQPIRLYGPGTNSGTFDYFTEVIVGTARASRADYTASEDDNVLVQGVAGDAYALGYFGFAYFWENRTQLKAVPVDGGNGCVAPTQESIRSNTYTPLARPLFIYVNNAALQRPEVAAFVRFYLEHAQELVPQTGYVPLAAEAYQAGLAQLPPAEHGH